MLPVFRVLIGLIWLAPAPALGLPKAAPRNPAFVRYKQRHPAAPRQIPAGQKQPRSRGLIPAPVDVPSHLRARSGRRALAAAPRSSSQNGCSAGAPACDLRSGYASPVKDQGACGDCWTYATFASLESVLLSAGQGSSCSGGSACIFDENNLNNTSGFLIGACNGGQYLMSAAYLSRRSGPLLASQTGACAGVATDNDSSAVCPVQKYLQGMYYLPNRSGPADNGAIKAAMAAYGAVYTSLNAVAGGRGGYSSCDPSSPDFAGGFACERTDAHFSTSAHSFYDFGCGQSDHAVTIVGWDDGYPASSFSTPPPGSGAFIVKNSWGAGWGDSGYFYLSYYSGFGSGGTTCVIPPGPCNVNTYGYEYLCQDYYQSLTGSMVLDLPEAPASPSSSAHIYYQDPDGVTDNFSGDSASSGTVAWMADVFMSNAARQETISQIGFYTLDTDVSYSVQLYLDPADPANPASGTPVFSAPSTGTYQYAGYHVLPVPGLTVQAGQKFSVVIRLADSSWGYPIAADDPQPGYSRGAAGAAAGQSFYSADGVHWNDFNAPAAQTAACIQALTTARDASNSVAAAGGSATFYAPSGQVTLQIPPGAFSSAVGVTLSLPSSFPPAGDGMQGTGVGIAITLDQPVQPALNATLSVPFRDSDLAGLDAGRLILARFDAAQSVWVPLVSSLDALNNVVTTQTNHFSTFQLMQAGPFNTVASAKAFPNPLRPSQGQTAMTFAQLPSQARLRIYDLRGALIKDLSADSTGMSSWDGTNQSGARVASGVYFVFAQGGGQERTFKVAVQR